MPFAVSIADIESRWRDLSSDDSDIATVRLADAERKVRLERPGLLTFYNALVADVPPITVKADLLATVREACANAVIRYLRNPDVTLRQDINSDGSIGIGYDTRSDGGIYISAADLADIDAAVGAASGVTREKVRSQRLVTTYPYRTTGDVTILPTP